MKTKLVTSYYPFCGGAPYWGQINRDRWYKYSLAAISNMSEIVCYTNPDDRGYNELVELKEKYDLKNLTIKIYDIKDNPYQERVYKIRTEKKDIYDNPEAISYYSRPTAIYWMKFLFLEMEYEPQTWLYWIDCGLSHSGLFPPSANKYGEEPEFANLYGSNYMENEYKVYHYDKAFTPEILEKINNYTGDKIVNLYRPTSDDNPSDFNRKLGRDLNYENIHPVGGFFGGKSDLVLPFIGKCKELIESILQAEEVCSDQSVLAYVNLTNREMFKNWYFDTFYHEGWTNVYSPEQVSFSHFFLKPLI